MAGLNVGFVGEGIEGVLKAALRLLSKIGHQILWVLLLQHGQQILQDSIHFTAFCKIPETCSSTIEFEEAGLSSAQCSQVHLRR